ncbi:uncharacterized protein LOC112049606 [Bicyclus anynana]|uniref:Uncharacterized protein LOC112049606 n=1 Tax=Bicyclus anynana TaxID=110368 RepID=A0ABM3M1J3_BICAN|nr:uncharacterized protein LOC112049606 [Bicyclus anynana]
MWYPYDDGMSTAVYAHLSVADESARIISPHYAAANQERGCLFLSYKLKYTGSNATIRVYQKPNHLPLNELLNLSDEAKKDYIIFEVRANPGDLPFYSVLLTLKQLQDDGFQIIIEGVPGVSFATLTVHNANLLQGSECTDAEYSTSLPSPDDVHEYYVYTTTTTPPTTIPPPTTRQQPLGINDYEIVIYVIITVLLIVTVLILLSILVAVTRRLDVPDSLNTLWMNIVGTYSRRNTEQDVKPLEVEYSTKNSHKAVIQ